MTRKNPSFSVSDFRDYMARNAELSSYFGLNETAPDPRDELIGRSVRARVSTQKLAQRIRPEAGDADALIADLVEDGGTILGVDGAELLIDVSCGSFYVPRFCVRLVKAD